jgi:hypothetical protein
MNFPNYELAAALEQEYCNLKLIQEDLQNKGLSASAYSVQEAMNDILEAVRSLGKQPNPPC